MTGTEMEKILSAFHSLSPENRGAYLEHLKKVVEAQGVTK